MYSGNRAQPVIGVLGAATVTNSNNSSSSPAPLNRRLGLNPDVFIPSQSQVLDLEDTLTDKNIVEGFADPMLVQDERGTFERDTRLQELNLTNLKGTLLQSVREIEWKKNNLNRQKKPEQRTKKGKNYPVQVAKPLDFAEKWIRSLATTDEPLHKLALTVPHGYKDFSLLKTLVKEKVPLLRASWYIKVIYLNRQKEQRQDIDPQTHWTDTLMTFLVSQIREISTNNKSALQGFTYTSKLINWNYREGLLDSDKLFTRLVQLLNEFTKFEELCLVVSILFEYLWDICKLSKVIIKQLVNACIQKLNPAKTASSSNDGNYQRLLYNSLRNMLSFVFIEAPDSLANLDYKLVATCIDATNPSLAFNDRNSDMSDSFYSQLWQQNQQLVQQLHLTYQNFLSAMIAQCNKTDPVEEFDKFFKKADLNDLYNALFGQPQKLDESISLVCEWAVTVQRSEEPYRPLLASILLYKHSETISQANQSSTNRPPFQNVLTKFLDTYVPKSSDELKQISKLFGEFIRLQIFSHDYYIRSLVSRGLLESSLTNKELSDRYWQFMKEFPVFNDNPSAQHEQNQRRSILMSFESSIANNQAQLIAVTKQEIMKHTESLKDLTVRSVSLPLGLAKTLKESSRYCQLDITTWLASEIKRNPHGLTVPLFLFSMRVFEEVEDYYGLTGLLLWVLQNVFIVPLDFTILAFLRKYEDALINQDIIADVLNRICDKIQSGAPDYVIDYLVEIRQKYRDIKAISQIAGSRFQMKDYLTANQKNQSNIISQFNAGSSFTAAVREIAALDTAVDRLSVLEALKAIFHAVLNSASKNTEILAKFVSVLGKFNEKWGSAYRIVTIALREDVIGTVTLQSDPSLQQALHHLLLNLVEYHFVELPQLISHIVVPILSKFNEKAKEVKDFEKFPITCLKILETILTGVGSQDITVCLPKKDQQYLSPVIMGAFFLVNKFSPDGVLAPLRTILDSIFRSQGFRKVCRSMAYSNDLYEHLHKLGDQSVIMQVYQLIAPSKGFKWAKADITKESITESILQISSNLDKWSLPISWLTLKLLIDVWNTVLEDSSYVPKQLITLLLKQFAVQPDASIYCKIIGSLGSIVQTQLLNSVQETLSNDQVLFGKISIRSYLLGTNDKNLGENAVDTAFIDLVVGSISNAAITDEQRKSFVLSILDQLETISRSLQTEFSSLNLSDIMEDVDSRTLYLQQSLHLRSTLLVPLIPTVRRHKKLCKFEELAKVMLLLLSSSIVHADEDLFSYLIMILDALFNADSVTQEDQVVMKGLTERLRSFFFELDFPLHQRLRIEQTVPTLSSTVPGTIFPITGGRKQQQQTTTTKRSLDVWTILEDYADAPLSPSSLGAEKIDRKELTYSSNPFELDSKRKKLL